MKNKTLFIVCSILLIIGGFIIGFASNGLYRDLKNERTLNGLYLENRNFTNNREAIETAKKYDISGDWVCVNTFKMTYEEAYNTCVHECSHQAYSEIFAEECEKDFNKCNKLIEGG